MYVDIVALPASNSGSVGRAEKSQTWISETNNGDSKTNPTATMVSEDHTGVRTFSSWVRWDLTRFVVSCLLELYRFSYRLLNVSVSFVERHSLQVLFIMKSAWQDQSTFYCLLLSLLTLICFRHVGIYRDIICIDMYIRRWSHYSRHVLYSLRWEPPLVFPIQNPLLTLLGGGVRSWRELLRVCTSSAIQFGTWSSDWTSTASFPS